MANTTSEPTEALEAPEAASRAGKASQAPEQVLEEGEHAPDYARWRIEPPQRAELAA